MSLLSHLEVLSSNLSAQASVITDQNSKEFKESLIRWSDLDIQTPTAIIKTANESDLCIAAEYAVLHSIPFVPKAGGHSLWSTIGSGGFILDLSLHKGIEIDASAGTVKVQAGVLTQDLNEAVAKAGFCVGRTSQTHQTSPILEIGIQSYNTVVTPNAPSVGVIPAVMAGGYGPTTGIHGLSIDNLISATIWTPTKGKVFASQTENSDLLWALKGAGHFFGVVIDITLQMHPLVTLGSNNGMFWSFNFIYGLHQMDSLLDVVETVAKSLPRNTSGAVILAAPPPHFQPRLVLRTHFFGSKSDARLTFAPFIDLKPMQYDGTLISFDQINDSMVNIDKKGGYKYFASAGLQKVEAQNIKRAFGVALELLDKYPTAKASVFVTIFYNPSKNLEVPEENSAFSNRDCCAMGLALPYAADQGSVPHVAQYTEQFLAKLREGQRQDQIAAYPTHTRSAPLSERYRGEARRARLKELKIKWDPKGVLTREFL